MENIILYGGRGANGGAPLFLKGNQQQSGSSTADYNARFNVLGVRSEEKTLAHFKQLHNNDKKESSIVIDAQGFTHGYTHGNNNSVIPSYGMVDT